MKAYIVDVANDDIHASKGERSDYAVAMVTEIALAALRLDQDRTVHAIFFNSVPQDASADLIDENVYLARPADPAQLRQWMYDALHPYREGGGQIRSSLTCRCVVFGYDGQVLICLRSEDPAPVSPDPSIVVVQERPDLIARCDYFDGYVPWDE